MSENTPAERPMLIIAVHNPHLLRKSLTGVKALGRGLKATPAVVKSTPGTVSSKVAKVRDDRAEQRLAEKRSEHNSRVEASQA